MHGFTPRQLRAMAERVDILTKARRSNETMGVPSTPDVMRLRFPFGVEAIVAWTKAELTSTTARIQHPSDCYRYLLYVGTAEEVLNALGSTDEQGPVLV